MISALMTTIFWVDYFTTPCRIYSWISDGVDSVKLFVKKGQQAWMKRSNELTLTWKNNKLPEYCSDQIAFVLKFRQLKCILIQVTHVIILGSL